MKCDAMDVSVPPREALQHRSALHTYTPGLPCRGQWKAASAVLEPSLDALESLVCLFCLPELGLPAAAGETVLQTNSTVPCFFLLKQAYFCPVTFLWS